MASVTEVRYGVWLGERRIGFLHQRGDHTRFVFADDYATDPDRPVLSLAFEENPVAVRTTSALRLPPWFSGLLPEGTLRDWIAQQRGVSPDREMELLAEVGHDLPGAVRVLPDDGTCPEGSGADGGSGRMLAEPRSMPPDGFRFSLAGVALKFSLLRVGDRLTVPAADRLGDWIVKLPDRAYADVPRNEHATMSLAAAVGIEVPEVRLRHRNELPELPDGVWPNGEDVAYSVRRFDRGVDRTPIHAEDLAQVRGFYPEHKYRGDFETVAALLYRGHDLDALREFARRLTFNLLIGNGDAHLKNWSLLYRDARHPTLAPAYDLVAADAYQVDGGADGTLALRLDGSKRPSRARLASFDRLARKVGATDADLAGVAVDTADRIRTNWPMAAELLATSPRLVRAIADTIEARYRTLTRKVTA